MKCTRQNTAKDTITNTATVTKIVKNYLENITQKNQNEAKKIRKSLTTVSTKTTKSTKSTVSINKRKRSTTVLGNNTHLVGTNDSGVGVKTINVKITIHQIDTLTIESDLHPKSI